MPTKFKSPFASSFKSGIMRGTPCGSVIQSICKKTGKSSKSVIMSLCKAGLCCCQKFNGQYVCWPTFPCKRSASNAKTCQTQMWQCFVDWCLCNGMCTPKQLTNKCGSQKTFMSGCRSTLSKQFSGSASRKSSRKSSKRRTTKARRRTSPSWTSRRWSTSRNYKFPTYRSHSRRYTKAA